MGPFLLDIFYTGYNLEFPISGILHKENINLHIFMEAAFVSLAWLAAVLQVPPTLAYTGSLFWLSLWPVSPLARTTFMASYNVCSI